LRTRFLLAFVFTLGIGALLLALGKAAEPGAPTPTRSRPTISPSSGYEFRWQAPGSAEKLATIAADGAGCEVLGSSQFLYTACVLATNEDAAGIGGQAFGHINEWPTPAREAVIWRAVLDGDPAVCAEGGLLTPSLEECQAAVGAGTRTATDQGFSATVTGAGGTSP